MMKTNKYVSKIIILNIYLYKEYLMITIKKFNTMFNYNIFMEFIIVNLFFYLIL